MTSFHAGGRAKVAGLKAPGVGVGDFNDFYSHLGGRGAERRWGQIQTVAHSSDTNIENLIHQFERRTRG